MHFADTTAWRVAQVATGWTAGVGTVLTLMTASELTQRLAPVPVVVLGVTVVAWAAYALASQQVAARRRRNIHYLAEASAAPILHQRRIVEARAARVRTAALAAFLGLCLAFLIMLFSVQCPDEACAEQPAPVPDAALVAVQYAALATGAAFGAAASFLRVYRGETDDIELKALQNDRGDDGIPGMPSGGWD